jgi:hypothetical protein
MAGRGRRLPKWQARANAVPNDIKKPHSKYRAKKRKRIFGVWHEIIFEIFKRFCLQCSIYPV